MPRGNPRDGVHRCEGAECLFRMRFIGNVGIYAVPYVTITCFRRQSINLLSQITIMWFPFSKPISTKPPTESCSTRPLGRPRWLCCD